MKKVIIFTFNIIFFSITTIYGLIGDPNNDGTIDIVDALITAQYYVGLNPLNFDVNEADVNADGSIDIVDAMLIAQYYVGIINEFPGGTQTPTFQPTNPPTPPPSSFTPLPDITPTPVPTTSVPFSVEVEGALPLEMGNRDSWYNSVLSGDYLYMTSEMSFKVFDISQPHNPVFTGFCEIPMDTESLKHKIIIDGNYAYVSCSSSDSKNLLVIDISDPFSPRVITSITMPLIYSMVLHGNYLYIGCFEETYVVDVRNPDNPVIFDEIGLFRAANMVINGSYVYMVDSNNDLLFVYDITIPYHPEEILSVSINSGVDNIILSGQYAYLQGKNIIEVYDISSPASPFFISSFTASLSSSSKNVIYDTLLYSIAYGDIHIIDISDPEHLALLTTLTIENANSLSIRDSTGYLVCGKKDYTDTDFLQRLAVYDFSNPLSPVFITEINGTRDISSIKVSDTYVYMTDRAGPLKCIDISNPAHPILSGSVSLDNPYNLQVRDNYLYIADGTGGFKIVDISNPGMPVITASLPTHDIAVDVYLDDNNAYIADQSAGITVIDISNPAFPQEIDSTAGEPRPTSIPLSPTPIPTPTEPIGVTPTPVSTAVPEPTPDIDIWNAMNLVVKDTHIILGTGFSPEIKVLTKETLDPVSVLEPDSESYDYMMNGFHLYGDYLYFVMKNNLFRVMDVTDASIPSITDGVVLRQNVRGNGLTTYYPYAFTSSWEVDVINITNPHDISEAGCIEIPGRAGGIAFQNGYLYIPSRQTNYELIIIRTDLE
jgi:hypothetical protein